MSLPAYADGELLSASALNALDDKMTAHVDHAMALGVPWLEQVAEYEKGKRGYVVHRHETATHANEALYYDLLIAGVGGGATITVKYHGTALYVFDGSDAAHDNGRQRGAWSLHDFPAAGTHPADGAWVQVDVESNNAAASATIYALWEWVSDPAGFATMADAGDDALTDTQGADVATHLQMLATNASALDGLAHGRIPGFWVKSRGIDPWRKAPVIDSTPVTVGTWYWHSHSGGILYYKIGVFKENEGAYGGNKKATVKVYVQPDSDVSATLVKTLYAGGTPVQDPTGGGRGERIYESRISIYALGIDPNIGELCKVYVTCEYDGTTTDGYAGCKVYMLREEALALPDYIAFSAEFTHGAMGAGDGPTQPYLRAMWLNMKTLSADDGASGYGTTGLDLAGGYPAGYALLVHRNPVMFGGEQQGIDRGYWIDELGFVRTKECLRYRVQGTADLIYLDQDGNEARRRLDPYTDDDAYFTFDLAEVADLQESMLYTIQCILTLEPFGHSANLVFGAWEGDAE